MEKMCYMMASIGVLGGFLCAAADCLLDLKGADNQKLSLYIESKWSVMAPWRFTASGILAMFAVPMYTCGFLALTSCFSEEHMVFAQILRGIFCCGAMGGFMIHCFLCLMPTVYRDVMEVGEFSLAQKLISDMFRQILVPFAALYTLLVIVPAIGVVYAILTGILTVPKWFALLNPVVFQVLGLLLRATGLKCFVDLPSICAASLGLAMYGVTALAAM